MVAGASQRDSASSTCEPIPFSRATLTRSSHSGRASSGIRLDVEHRIRLAKRCGCARPRCWPTMPPMERPRIMGARQPQVVHQGDGIGREHAEVVGRRRCLAGAVPARIEAHHAVARQQRRGQLVPDAEIGGERMMQHHGGGSLGALDREIHAKAVDGRLHVSSWGSLKRCRRVAEALADGSATWRRLNAYCLHRRWAAPCLCLPAPRGWRSGGRTGRAVRSTPRIPDGCPSTTTGRGRKHSRWP